MTLFMELDMGYYLQKTSAEFYSDRLLHVNPELCYFVLVAQNHFIAKYARAKLARKAAPARPRAGAKKLKQVKVAGDPYDGALDSTATNDQARSFQPSKTEDSLTKLLAQPEPGSGPGLSKDFAHAPFDKVRSPAQQRARKHFGGGRRQPQRQAAPPAPQAEHQRLATLITRRRHCVQ